ncbi:response regulator transcription factor [Arthrobacter sp. MDT3-44]
MLIDNELPSTQATAVVIEDDLDIRNIVCATLQQAGFDVQSAATGRAGVDIVRDTTPTIVTLDVGLPDIDGYEVLRRIRDVSDCYVIMLTARTGESDTLTALQGGADDYLTKPFRPRELRARIDTMRRRPRTGTTTSLTPQAVAPSTPAPALKPEPATGPAPVSVFATRTQAVLRRGELVLDGEARTVQVADQEVPLTKSEFDLLYEMLRSKGAVRTKFTLVGVLRGDEHRSPSYVSDADQRTVEVHMGNLRRKLSHHLGDTDLITTVRGVGYRITPLPRTNAETSGSPASADIS